MNALELQQIHIMSVSIVLHLTTLQMLGTPFSVASRCPSKHGIQVTESLHLIDIWGSTGSCGC